MRKKVCLTQAQCEALRELQVELLKLSPEDTTRPSEMLIQVFSEQGIMKASDTAMMLRELEEVIK